MVFRTRVAVGAAAHPTPTGRFGVTDKLPGRRFGSVYGCCILAISAIQEKLPANWPGGNRIALHGTNLPSSIGNPVSTGCVRVGERPLRRMMRRVPLGTPVIIRPEPVPDAANGLQGAGAVAELAPQAGDRDVDDVRAAGPFVAPDVAQERVARHGLPLAVDQVAHHVALELGERDPVAVEAQLAGGVVEAGGGQVEVARGERRRAS